MPLQHAGSEGGPSASGPSPSVVANRHHPRGPQPPHRMGWIDTVVLRAAVPTPGPLNQNHGVWGLQAVFNQTLLGPPRCAYIREQALGSTGSRCLELFLHQLARVRMALAGTHVHGQWRDGDVSEGSAGVSGNGRKETNRNDRPVLRS